GPGKSLDGLGLIGYEGGDNNSPAPGFWALFGAGLNHLPNPNPTFTGSITGTLLTDAAGAATKIAIGADITGGTAAAGTLVTGVRLDLGPGNFTVNISQTVASSTLTV